MIRKITGWLMVGLLLVATGAPSCSDSSGYKKAVQANHDLSIGLVAGSKVLASLYDTKTITGEDYLAILAVEQDIVNGAKELNTLLTQAKELTPNNKGSFLIIIDHLIASVDNLNSTGALRIKSSEGQAKFAAAIATAKVSLTTIKVFIAAVSKPTPVPVALQRESKQRLDSLVYQHNYNILQQQGVFDRLRESTNAN